MNTDFIGTSIQGFQVAQRVRAARHWLVRSGGNVIGPVSLELLERGLDAGRIPGNAEMALLGGKDWRPVAEILRLPSAAAEEAPTESVTVAPIVEVDTTNEPQARLAPSEPPAAQPVQTYAAPQPQPAVNCVPQPAQDYPVAQPLPFRVAQAQARAHAAQEAQAAQAAQAAYSPMAIPPATPSGHYPDDPVTIPKQGMVSSLFG